MATKKYTAGKFEVYVGISNRTVGELIDMTLTINIDVGDTSKVGTAWAGAVELGKNWAIAINCNYDPADTGQAYLLDAVYSTVGAEFPALRYYEGATGVHAGTGMLTSAVVTKSVGSVDKFSATFAGNSALTYASS